MLDALPDSIFEIGSFCYSLNDPLSTPAVDFLDGSKDSSMVCFEDKHFSLLMTKKSSRQLNILKIDRRLQFVNISLP